MPAAKLSKNTEVISEWCLIGELTGECSSLSAIVVFALAVIPGGFWADYCGKALCRISTASTTWPNVDGRIVETKVKKIHNDDGYAYQPIVQYVYTVDGKEFTGDRVSFDGLASQSRESAAHALLGGYVSGKQVSVSYKPEAWQCSNLVVHLRRSRYQRVAFGFRSAVQS